MDQPTPPPRDPSDPMDNPFKPALSGSPTGDPHPSHMVILITNDPNASAIVERTNYHDCTVVAAIPHTPEEESANPDAPKIEEYLAQIVSHNANHGLVTHAHVCLMGTSTFDYDLLTDSITTTVSVCRVQVDGEEGLRAYIEEGIGLKTKDGLAETNKPVPLDGESRVGAVGSQPPTSGSSTGLSDFLERVGNSIPNADAEPTADWWERKFTQMKLRLEAVRHRNMDLEGLITNATALNDRLLAIIEKLAEGPSLSPEDDLFIPKDSND